MGGPKAYPWEASVDTPRLPPFRQDCVRRNRDQRLHNEGRAPMPVGALFRLWTGSLRPLMRAMSGTRRRKFRGPKWAIRNEPLDQSGLTKNIYWAQSGRHWTRQSELPICGGTNLQIWGETAMKWSQAICASILVDEFYLLSLNARSNPRSGRDVPRLPVEPAFRPNLFTADWGLPPNPARTRPPKPQADAS